MDSKTPTRKVTGGALAGAVSFLIMWGLSQAGYPVSGELGAALTTIVTFATSWLVSDPD